MPDLFERLDAFHRLPFTSLQETCDSLHKQAQEVERGGDQEQALEVGIDFVAAHAALSTLATKHKDPVMAMAAAKLSKDGLGVLVHKIDALSLPSDPIRREGLKKELLDFHDVFFAKSPATRPKRGCLAVVLTLLLVDVILILI